MKNKIIILAGEICSGKTSFLLQFCRQQTGSAGVLTPIVEGKRVFYDIRNAAFFKMQSEADEQSLLIGKYSFSAAAFAKANSILLSEGSASEVKYLVIDEIGPLEINLKQGFYDSLTTLLSGQFSYTLVLVVRNSFLEKALNCFRLDGANIYTVSEMNHQLER